MVRIKIDEVYVPLDSAELQPAACGSMLSLAVEERCLLGILRAGVEYVQVTWLLTPLLLIILHGRTV